MSLSLDNFINNAVKQVRDSKKTGKVGRKARKEIRSDELLFQQTKASIRQIAKDCEARAWKPTRLVMMKVQAKCKSCGELSPACAEAIYLEKVHAKCGTIQTRLDDIQINSYPDLPRTIQSHDCESYICSDCFISYSPSQLEFPFEEKEAAKYVNVPTKWRKEYDNFSQNYDKQMIAKAINWLLPKTLLLEHKPL